MRSPLFALALACSLLSLPLLVAWVLRRVAALRQKGGSPCAR
jgi:hypothetical protein